VQVISPSIEPFWREAFFEIVLNASEPSDDVYLIYETKLSEMYSQMFWPWIECVID